MTDPIQPSEHPEVVDAPSGEVPTETVTEPAKVMRIGSMVKQLLEEVRTSPLDEASRERLAEIYERSIAELSDGVGEVRDANGNLLAAGDDVIVIKDLKLNGKTGGVKSGTKVKSIRLVAGDHPIDGKVDGRGILIKAEFVRRA